MSLFLGMLGSTALLGASIAAPVTATIPTTQSSRLTDLVQGVYKIDEKLEAQISADQGINTANTATFASFRIPWIELGIGPITYSLIDWEDSLLILNSTLFYQNNVLPYSGSGTMIKKQERYTGEDLKMMFIQPIKLYEDGRNESNANSSVDHTWEYIFSDDTEDLVLDTKVWVSASNDHAWSYASITFTSMLYKIAVYLE